MAFTILENSSSNPLIKSPHTTTHTVFITHYALTDNNGCAATSRHIPFLQPLDTLSLTFAYAPRLSSSICGSIAINHRYVNAPRSVHYLAMERSVSLDDVEKIAAGVLSPSTWGYIASGAETESALRENRAALQRYRLLPRVLVRVCVSGGEGGAFVCGGMVSYRVICTMPFSRNHRT